MSKVWGIVVEWWCWWLSSVMWFPCESQRRSSNSLAYADASSRIARAFICYIKENIVNTGSNRIVIICTYHAKLRLIGSHPTPRPISIHRHNTPHLFHHHPLQTGIASVIDSVNFGDQIAKTCSTKVLDQWDIIFHLAHRKRVIKVSRIEFHYHCMSTFQYNLDHLQTNWGSITTVTSRVLPWRLQHVSC